MYPNPKPRLAYRCPAGHKFETIQQGKKLPPCPKCDKKSQPASWLVRWLWRNLLHVASSIGIARLAARNVFGEGVSFSVRTATKDEIAQARGGDILNEAGE